MFLVFKNLFNMKFTCFPMKLWVDKGQTINKIMWKGAMLDAAAAFLICLVSFTCDAKHEILVPFFQHPQPTNWFKIDQLFKN